MNRCGADRMAPCAPDTDGAEAGSTSTGTELGNVTFLRLGQTGAYYDADRTGSTVVKKSRTDDFLLTKSAGALLHRK